MIRLLPALALALLLTAASLTVPVHAAKKDDGPATDVERGAKAFLKQTEQVRKDLKKSDKYEEIKGEDRAKVLATLDRMERTMSGVDSIDQLSENQRIDLYNDQEQVNALLTQAREDSRQVCQRVKTVGSNMARLQCETVAERQRRIARESAEINRRLETGRNGDNVARQMREGGG